MADPVEPTNVPHERCVGCGAMDDELEGPCVLYGVMHSTVTVDEDGNISPSGFSLALTAR